MILHTLEQVSKCKTLDDICVATDDSRIRDVVKKAGGNVVMTSLSCPSGTDRVFEASKKMALKGDDLVFNIQGDEPFINPNHIDSLVNNMAKTEHVRMGTLAVEESEIIPLQEASTVKIVVDCNMDALYFSRSVIPFPRNIPQGMSHLRHIGLYGYRYAFLKEFTELPTSQLEQCESLEQLRALEHGHKIKVYLVEGPAHHGVDTMEDLKHLEKIIS
mmetsp:Transcript_11019/g.20401  ORF Transcript_11019/g.20401 Transcript_11019/m.20401 type:complete len:217 (-) Transcript_11019:3898-4548(-)